MHRILVMLPNNLGDVIMTLPVLQALKAHSSETHITFLVEAGYEGGLVHSRYCDRILFIPRKEVKTATTGDGWRDASRLLRVVIKEIVTSGCDVVVNLAQHPYCSFLATLVGAPEICGRYYLRQGNHALDDWWSQYLYAIPYSRTSNALHASDVYCRIAGTVRTDDGSAALTLTRDELERGMNYLSENGYSDGRRIAVLQPGAAYPSKRWPREHFVALGKMLVADGYYLVVTGAAAERMLAATIVNDIGDSCILTAGKLSFRETIALCACCSLVVCGDTALMHAAAALGKKVFACFGPTNPVETGPYGTGHYIFSGECPERPCFRTDCSRMHCMQSITPDIVYAYIKGCKGQSPQCTVFTTCFSRDAWQCLPVGNHPNPYCDTVAAAYTRHVFEPHYRVAFASAVDPTVVATSIEFARICREMEHCLVAIRKDRSAQPMQRFEQLRRMAAAESGISAFWNAILNIRLNSVPLLDPEAGLEGSITACRVTHQQITEGLSV